MNFVGQQRAEHARTAGEDIPDAWSASLISDDLDAEPRTDGSVERLIGREIDDVAQCLTRIRAELDTMRRHDLAQLGNGSFQLVEREVHRGLDEVHDLVRRLRGGPTFGEQAREAERAAAPIRVLIADDQTLFLSGLARLLAEDPRVEVVGEAGDGVEVVAQCQRLQPDVVLMDVRLPRMDGLAATRRIVEAGGGTKVLILTTIHTEPDVVAALEAGASGYALKDSRAEALISSIVAVKLGGQVVASSVAGHVLSKGRDHRTPRELHEELTPRETEILNLVAAGTSNKEIARQLEITAKTVRNHLSHIYEKLHINDRSHVVLYAMHKGLVNL